ncbi:MAG: OsmC family protein [Methylophilaceae bacterium]
MKVRVKWIEDVAFMGESETGHAVVLDGAPENGGRNIGMRPMEMLLIGMGSCTSFDVVTILKKSRQPVVDCVADITAERSDEIPKVFTKIHVHFVITGNDLNEKQVARAVALSAEKYCSASIMLSKSVEITHDFEIKSTEIKTDEAE